MAGAAGAGRRVGARSGSRDWHRARQQAVACRGVFLGGCGTSVARLRYGGPTALLGGSGGRGRLRVAPWWPTPAASARRPEGGRPSLVGGPKPPLGADWRRGWLLITRPHHLAGLPLVSAGAPLADRL